MAWETLKTDYTDAIWVGKKRYNQITNSDGTLSFDDVTEYSQKENSFYGADDANSTNEAINYIMKALENDTDLYTDFKTYFDNQKTAFSSTGETMMRDLQEGYQARIEAYESEQEDTFEEWIATLKAKLDSTDVAKLQSEIEALETSSKVTLTDNGSTSSYAKTYTISQGGSSIGTINIPKDLVVTSGSVVKNPTSSLTGTYIKLVIANQTDPLYINVADLCDVYTGGSTATVKVAVSSTNQITASIVSGSVSKTMLDSSVQSTLNTASASYSMAKDNALSIDNLKMYPIKVQATKSLEFSILNSFPANIICEKFSNGLCNIYIQGYFDFLSTYTTGYNIFSASALKIACNVYALSFEAKQTSVQIYNHSKTQEEMESFCGRTGLMLELNGDSMYFARMYTENGDVGGWGVDSGIYEVGSYFVIQIIGATYTNY